MDDLKAEKKFIKGHQVAHRLSRRLKKKARVLLLIKPLSISTAASTNILTLRPVAADRFFGGGAGIKLRASCFLGKCSTTEPSPNPNFIES